MIELTDINGRRHAISARSILRVVQAAPNQAWHGVGSTVELASSEGWLEVRESYGQVMAAVAEELKS